MCNNIIVLNSVYTQRNGSYIENKIFWDDLTEQGKEIYIQSEVKSFIHNDFKSDRFYISSFLDKFELWGKFEVAKKSINVIPVTCDDTDMIKVDLKDWFDDDPIFSFEVFCSLLDSLNMLLIFNQFMLNECVQLEKERFECGYPLIVRDNIKFELLTHIVRNTQ